MGADLVLMLYVCVGLALGGAVFGSFVDCAVWRFVREEPVFWERSHCASCGHILTARDLVPLLSYLAMQGRCRHCKEKIPAECLWAEAAGAAAFVCLGMRFGISPELVQWLILGVLLLAVSLMDGAKRIIPDRLLLTLLGNRVLWVLVLQKPLWESGKIALASLCAGPLPLLVLTLFMEWLFGREFMGGGDIKLLGALALYLEWPQMVLTLFGGCLLGLFSAAAGRKRGAFAFGPYLAAACVIAVCFGDPLITWYLG